MLARRRTIAHPLAAEAKVDLPLLVPAFSSKGFPFYRDDTKSEVTEALKLTGNQIRSTLLLSAYDVGHNHFVRPQQYYRNKQLIFIDSGAYELSGDWDSTEPKQPPYAPKAFDEDNYVEVLSALPGHLPFVIANYDWGTRDKGLVNQILAAQELFASFPDYMTTFIIKPGRRKLWNITRVIPHVDKLRNFGMVGVVEKELGEDLLERLCTIALLRIAMDRAGVDVPIHVWGGLDPILTPLYFFSGAEVFDGVSWLRYAYHNGVAVSRESHPVLCPDLGLQAGAGAKLITLQHNLNFLERLTEAMRQFVDKKGRSFSMFDELDNTRKKEMSTVLKRAFEVLGTRIAEVKGAG